jgi:hypothetical protein
MSNTSPERNLSKEELISIITRLLRADDLSFLMQLGRDDIERLVTALRARKGF